MKRWAVLIGVLCFLSAAMGYDPLYTEDGASMLDHMQLRTGAGLRVRLL